MKIFYPDSNWNQGKFIWVLFIFNHSVSIILSTKSATSSQQSNEFSSN